MISVYDLKPRFQDVLRPLCKQLVRVGVSANQVTITAILFSLIVGAALLIWSDHFRILLILPIALCIRMALNAIDGMIAREYNMQTSIGAVLNELGDVVSDAAIYLPLAIILPNELWLIVLIVLLSTMSEMVGIQMRHLGASRRYEGPMGKSDRALAFGTAGLLLGIGISQDIWLSIILWVIIALLCLTIMRRVRAGLRELATESTDQP